MTREMVALRAISDPIDDSEDVADGDRYKE